MKLIAALLLISSLSKLAACGSIDKFPELPIDNINDAVIKSVLVADGLIGLLCGLYILFI